MEKKGKHVRLRRYVLWGTFCLFFVVSFYILSQILLLHLFVKRTNQEVKPLTREEKEEDFVALTNYVKKCYPYADAVSEIKGLSSITSLEEEFIKRASETKDNAEFLKVFLEYTQLIGQGGHYGVRFLSPEDASVSFCYMFGLRKDAFNRSAYWNKLANTLDLYSHSSLSVLYREGDYYLTEDKEQNGVLLPCGSKIVTMESVPVDEYVRSLEKDQVLFYDLRYQKVYSGDLFQTPPKSGERHWKVLFQKPDGQEAEVLLPVLKGYQKKEDAKSYLNGENVVCLALNESTGYIYISSFEMMYQKSDQIKIREFMEASEGRFTTLILDVRGNTGGEPSSFMENLIEPLLKGTVQYKERTVVKKSYFSGRRLRYNYYRMAATNHLWKKEKNRILRINSVTIPGFPSSEWNAYEITREFKGKNAFPFSGKVYVMCDKETLSAGDLFVRTVQNTELGIVVGQNTLGLGNLFMQPNLFSLPNSGLIFQMDIEIPLNQDGTENSIYGTTPDFLLPETVFPKRFTVEELLKDEWIQQILSGKLQ